MGLITLFFQIEWATWRTWGRHGSETSCPNPAIAAGVQRERQSVLIERQRLWGPGGAGRRDDCQAGDWIYHSVMCDVWHWAMQRLHTEHQEGHWDNWSVTSELRDHLVTAWASSWVRLSPGESEQWAVVAPGSRHHRLHPGADGTWEHRRQHRLSQGEGGWSRGKQRPKVCVKEGILQMSENLTICLHFSKKWKKLLTFPHISECIDLVSTLRADNYDYIVGEQPIGNKLFRQFCQSNRKHYTHYNDFLDDVDNYETVLEENRTHEAQKIFTEYLSKPLGKFSLK